MDILYVDDEPYGKAVCLVLEKYNHKVKWAKSFDEAMNCISTEHYDVAIVDILMPALDDCLDPNDESQWMGMRIWPAIRNTHWGKSAIICVYTVLQYDKFCEVARREKLSPSDVHFISRRDSPQAIVEFLSQRLRYGRISS